MAVLERFDRPLDRWRANRNTRLDGERVVVRDSTDDSDYFVMTEKKKGSTGAPAVAGRPVEPESRFAYLFLWILFSVFGILNPIFMIIGYVLGRNVNRRVANLVFFLWLALVILAGAFAFWQFYVADTVGYPFDEYEGLVYG